MTPRATHRRAGDDRGVVLILIALSMLAILGIVAIVVDLGQLRADRRAASTAADVAAVAAGYHLSGRGTDPIAPSAKTACKGAINSIQTDIAGFRPALTDAQQNAACAGLPDTILAGCVASIPPVVITRGDYTLTIRYPVPSSEIVEPRFKNGVGVEDGSNMCERMRVSLRHTGDTFFAGVFGVDEQTISASTVVRANSSALIDGVAALLLLERMGCGVLQTSGGGLTGSGVVVQASSPTNPGVIQADSAGQVGTGLCTTNTNADGYVIYGTPLPAASGGGPSIRVEPAPNGAEGVVAIRAIEVGGRGGAVVPDGLYPAPVGSGINSRQVADDRYNGPIASGGSAQISTLHNEGRQLVTRDSAPNGYVTLSGSQCTNLDTTSDGTFATATHIFVLCPEFSPRPEVTFPAATHVIFTGKISIDNNDYLSLPVAQRIYVRGCPGCTGGNNYAISLKGGGAELRVNTAAHGTPDDPRCSGRPGPGAEPPGTFQNWAVLATFDGPFINSGRAWLCQTTAYLAKDVLAYQRQSVEATGVGSPSYPSIAGCSPTRPCPSDAGGDSFIDVTGGSGQFDWSAPNQITTPPTQSDFATSPFEDLALWSESSSGSSIKGQGANSTEGVFFLPNSTMTFTGQATQTQPLNAQFVARRLNVSGQGSLFLRPSKDDAVPTRIPGALSIIR